MEINQDIAQTLKQQIKKQSTQKEAGINSLIEEFSEFDLDMCIDLGTIINIVINDEMEQLH